MMAVSCLGLCNFWLVEDQLDILHATHLIFAGTSRFLAPLSRFPL